MSQWSDWSQILRVQKSARLMACLLKQLNPWVNSPGLYLLREKKDCSCHDLIESTLGILKFLSWYHFLVVFDLLFHILPPNYLTNPFKCPNQRVKVFRQFSRKSNIWHGSIQPPRNQILQNCCHFALVLILIFHILLPKYLIIPFKYPNQGLEIMPLKSNLWQL